MALSQVPQEALPIRIKGTGDGLVITVAESLGEEWLDQLEAEFSAQPDFWRGGRVALSVGGRGLATEHLGSAIALLERYGMRLWAVLSGSGQTRRAARELGLAPRLSSPRPEAQAPVVREVPRIGTAEQARVEEAGTAEAPASPPGVPALILRETLRSGRSVRHAGPIIVIGDVNPGAELLADGPVIVWGKLRGLVHAGAAGDAGAVVCALDLDPTQLRIADKITVPPKGPRRQPVPEMAVIRDQNIVAEPWRQKA
jgi:septum site-determining protein MinC